MAFRDVSKKWTVQGRNWGLIVNRLSIILDERNMDFFTSISHLHKFFDTFL